MTDPFSDPSSGFVKITDFQDKVLVVKPLKVLDSVPNKFVATGSPAVDVDLVVLNADGTYEEHQAVRVFQKALISQFTRSLGKLVIGTLAKEPTPNGFEAWVLQKATETDRALGLKYLEAKQNAALQTPAPAMAGAPAHGVDPLA